MPWKRSTSKQNSTFFNCGYHECMHGVLLLESFQINIYPGSTTSCINRSKKSEMITADLFFPACQALLSILVHPHGPATVIPSKMNLSQEFAAQISMIYITKVASKRTV